MRIRLRFTKLGKVRFTSHRDLARIWERALRRGEVPLEYSQGFSPRPRLHFGLALPTGAESEAEYLDADLREGAPAIDGLPARLSPLLPVGIDVTAVAPVEPGTESLQQAVVCCDWRIEVVGLADPQEAVGRVLAADEIPLARERKGQVAVDDVRPYVEALAVVAPTTTAGGVELAATLRTQPRGLRPAELVAALASTTDGGPGIAPGRMTRTHQWMQRDGARQEPLPTATPAPHAEARAS
jgi:radical SAM-linked protein